VERKGIKMPTGVYVRTKEHRKISSESHVKHGHARNGKMSKTYRAWESMRNRCSNPNHNRYKDWGGRGISVCSRWQGNQGFETFLADMGECPGRFVIDRIDNDGDYEPENCRWIDYKTSARNRRGIKLTQDDVDTIRKMSLLGLTQHEIASQFDVSRSMVGYVVRRKSWGAVCVLLP